MRQYIHFWMYQKENKFVKINPFHSNYYSKYQSLLLLYFKRVLLIELYRVSTNSVNQKNGGQIENYYWSMYWSDQPIFSNLTVKQWGTDDSIFLNAGLFANPFLNNFHWSLMHTFFCKTNVHSFFQISSSSNDVSHYLTLVQEF